MKNENSICTVKKRVELIQFMLIGAHIKFMSNCLWSRPKTETMRILYSLTTKPYNIIYLALATVRLFNEEISR